MKTITFNQFKKETHHKAVEYTFKPRKEGMPNKEFKTEKFYANKDYRLKMISMPKFLIGFIGIWFKLNSNEYKFKSEYGETYFKIII